MTCVVKFNIRSEVSSDLCVLGIALIKELNKSGPYCTSVLLCNNSSHCRAAGQTYIIECYVTYPF